MASNTDDVCDDYLALFLADEVEPGSIDGHEQRLRTCAEEDDLIAKDERLAKLLQQQESGGGALDVDPLGPGLDLSDPTPDIHKLFLHFNQRFFSGTLGCVSLKWSRQMTLCAGVCSFQKRAGFCEIRLSEPLLQFRSRTEMIETLLHEMIHAFLFVASNDRDRSAHGPAFCAHMRRINAATGLHITVYHTFHDEVTHFRTHWWQCDGPCRQRSPYFGLVKRSRNRAPGPNDFWWSGHQASCGGTFRKIRSPEPILTSKKATAKKKTNGALSPNKESGSAKQPRISDIFQSKNMESPMSTTEDSRLLSKQSTSSGDNGRRVNTMVFSGAGVRLGGRSGKSRLLCQFANESNAVAQRRSSTQLKPQLESSCFDLKTNVTNENRKPDSLRDNCQFINRAMATGASTQLACPVCAQGFPSDILAIHVNQCLDEISASGKRTGIECVVLD